MFKLQVTSVGFDFVMLAIIGLYLIVLFTVLVIATRVCISRFISFRARFYTMPDAKLSTSCFAGFWWTSTYDTTSADAEIQGSMSMSSVLFNLSAGLTQPKRINLLMDLVLLLNCFSRVWVFFPFFFSSRIQLEILVLFFSLIKLTLSRL